MKRQVCEPGHLARVRARVRASYTVRVRARVRAARVRVRVWARVRARGEGAMWVKDTARLGDGFRLSSLLLGLETG